MSQEASSSPETLDQSQSRNLSSRLNAQAPEFVPTRPDPAQPRLMVPPPPPPPGVIHMFPPPPFHVPPPHLLPMHHPRMPVQFHHPQHFHPSGGFAEQGKPRPDADHAYAAASASPKNGVSEEPSNKVLNQVEYYFSDLNLATTDHLMRYIKKDPEGYVPISVVASFKKIKAAINSHSHLATILRKSSKLVVSEDGKKVRRLHPLTESDIEELQSRIVVAENLPEDHCHQNLMKIFSAVGSVKTIRTCPPQPSGGMSASRSSKADNVLVSNKLHAYVEYESVELAEKAVAELNDEGNWRSGLRVRLMAKHSPKPTQSRGKKVHDGEGDFEEEDVSTSDQQSSEKQQDDVAQQADGPSHEQAGDEHVTEKEGGQRKGRGRGRGKGHGRAHPHHNNRGNHVGTPPNALLDGEMQSVAKQPPGPRMPDGTRGFSMGRGKPVAVDTS